MLGYVTGHWFVDMCKCDIDLVKGKIELQHASCPILKMNINGVSLSNGIASILI